MTNSQQLGPFLIHQMNSCCVREQSEYAHRRVCLRVCVYTTVHFCTFIRGSARICVCTLVCMGISQHFSDTKKSPQCVPGYA